MTTPTSEASVWTTPTERVGRPGSGIRPSGLARTTNYVGGRVVCWNYNLRACTEWMPATDHVGRGCPCDESPCKEWRVPRTGTAYRHDTLWMDDQPGKMELRSLSGPGCLYSQVFSLLWNAEGARSIHITPSAADTSVGGSPRYHHSSLTSLTSLARLSTRHFRMTTLDRGTLAYLWDDLRMIPKHGVGTSPSSPSGPIDAVYTSR